MQVVFVSTDPHSDSLKLTAAPDFADLSPRSVKSAIGTCGRDPACIANRAFRGVIAEQLRQVNSILDERDELEEKYRDYCCMHHEQVLPSEPLSTEVRQGLNELPAMCFGATMMTNADDAADDDVIIIRYGVGGGWAGISRNVKTRARQTLPSRRCEWTSTLSGMIP